MIFSRQKKIPKMLPRLWCFVGHVPRWSGDLRGRFRGSKVCHWVGMVDLREMKNIVIHGRFDVKHLNSYSGLVDQHSMLKTFWYREHYGTDFGKSSQRNGRKNQLLMCFVEEFWWQKWIFLTSPKKKDQTLQLRRCVVYYVYIYILLIFMWRVVLLV